jgi:hypothetical protein
MARSRIRYVPDRAGTNELMTSPKMLAGMVAAAEKGRAFAESISPRATGEYARSFTIESTRRGGPSRDRAEARLVNTAPHAAAVEWVNNGGERVLGRTVDFIEGEFA